jgi:hypothetical protein
VQVVAVREGRPEERGEPAVVGLVVAGELGPHRHVERVVVAEGQLVVAGVGVQPTVAPTAVQLVASAVPAVGRVGVVTAVEVAPSALAPVLGRDQRPVGTLPQVAVAGVLPGVEVGVLGAVPPEQVVERSVLLHQDHDVLHRRLRRAGLDPE